MDIAVDVELVALPETGLVPVKRVDLQCSCFLLWQMVY